MIFHSFNTFDAVQAAVLQKLFASGTNTAPRGAKTLEVVACGFTLINPRSRIVVNPARRWSMALAVGEFAWHVSASDGVEPLAYYAPIWRQFSSDGAYIRGSCYGKRIFDRDGTSLSQWDALVRLLRSDPASRRAMLSVQQTPIQALDIASPDVPCVTTCQFLVRDGRLDAIVHMRSNDVIWGLPYDVFLFTMLQEMLSLELGVDLGRYHHFAGSLHLYDKHFDLARRILSSPSEGSEMQPMTDVDELPAFIEAERNLRCGAGYTKELSPYWSGLLASVADFAARRAA